MAAELAMLDAFAGSAVPELAPGHSDDTLSAEDHEDTADAVVRLEDIVEPDTIASEEVASRTIGLTGDYAVEAKDLHVILEDIAGGTEFDRRDVTFEANQTYVGMRIGRKGDEDFPERLLLHRCLGEEEAEDVS
jgi:hypothetical protein